MATKVQGRRTNRSPQRCLSTTARIDDLDDLCVIVSVVLLFHTRVKKVGVERVWGSGVFLPSKKDQTKSTVASQLRTCSCLQTLISVLEAYSYRKFHYCNLYCYNL
jgi:hypothetical protein